MVYVDDLTPAAWRFGYACHMIADNEDELHAFAERLGLKREWFQKGHHPHYDLSEKKRNAALKIGAVALSRVDFIAKVRKC